MKEFTVNLDAVWKCMELRDRMGYPSLEGVDPARLAEISRPPGESAVRGHDPVERPKMLPVPLWARDYDDGIVLLEVSEVSLIPDVGNDVKALEFLLGQDLEIPRWMDRPVEGSVVLVDPEVDDNILPIDLLDCRELNAPEDAFSPLVVPAGSLEVTVKDVVSRRPRPVEEVSLVGDGDRHPVDAPSLAARSIPNDVVRREARQEPKVVLLREESRGDVLEKIIPKSSLILDLNAHAG